MLAKDCGFTCIYGELESIDRQRKQLLLKPVYSAAGQEIFPARSQAYDTLALAVGSTSNFFGTPGAAEFAIAHASPDAAERSRQRQLHELVLADRCRSVEPHSALDHSPEQRRVGEWMCSTWTYRC